jgi:hypothetical protein
MSLQLEFRNDACTMKCQRLAPKSRAARVSQRVVLVRCSEVSRTVGNWESTESA